MLKHRDTKARRHEGTKKGRKQKFLMRPFFVPSCLCVSVFKHSCRPGESLRKTYQD